MKFIIVELKGGLGNQMFQYASARGMFSSSRIFFDLSFLAKNQTSSSTFTARSFELGIFERLIFRTVNFSLVECLRSSSPVFKMIRFILRNKISYIKQNENELISEFSEKKIFYVLDGYFQSEKYFFNIRKELIDVFFFPSLDELNKNVSKKIRLAKEPVSLHIRRGDYLKPHVESTHGILALSYYLTSIDYLRSLFEEITLFVFSDDINWAKKNLICDDVNIIWVDVNVGKDSWKDMKLMSLCKHHIIANSSFSWWGAWLSELNGIKIAPKNWFNSSKVIFNISDFIPESWIILP